MSTAAKAKAKDATASAVAQFVAQHMNSGVVHKTAPEGPITYVIVGVTEGRMVGLSKDNGDGKGEYILLKKQGDGDAKPIQLNPNVILDLHRGVEHKDYELAGDKQDGAIETTETTETTQEAGAGSNEGGTNQGAIDAAAATKTEEDAKAAAKAKAEADRKAKVEAKAKEKAEKEAARKAEADKKAEREKAEADARAQKKASKEANSVKTRALRIYREELKTSDTSKDGWVDSEGKTHRSRVMAKFRGLENEGGLGLSTQHANTYYQNCKSQWMNDKLPEDITPAKQDKQDTTS